MEKILSVDLSTKEIKLEDYDLSIHKHYGRGLAMDLIEKRVPTNADRYSEENAMVFIPGLLTGCKVASCCRLMVATKEDRNKGLQLSNITGNFPQKLASYSIAAIVIKGISQEKNTVLHIGKNSIEILSMPNLEKKNTSVIIKNLKDKFGVEAGIIAVGKTADMQMSLSSFICTYPNGKPEYNCPRSGFGDVMGSKNLRAVIVTNEKYFERECIDEKELQESGKILAKLIIENDICGGALPSHGSVTLIKILKHKENLLKKLNEEKLTYKNKVYKKNKEKTNYCCAPMCVIGCLNRHSLNDGQVYSAPDESEIHEALKASYGIDDYEYTKELRSRAYELGIVGTEFVTATKIYFEATGLSSGKEEILNLLNEIEEGSVIGRLIASRTLGISKTYSDNKNLFYLLDRAAIEDEKKYHVSLNKFKCNFEEMSDMDLLYAQIFILENLGFCIFSSFAIVNNEEALELMAKLFKNKTGIDVTVTDLISYARDCMKREIEYEKTNAVGNIKRNVPPFTKVLYRYFSK